MSSAARPPMMAFSIKRLKPVRHFDGDAWRNRSQDLLQPAEILHVRILEELGISIAAERRADAQR